MLKEQRADELTPAQAARELGVTESCVHQKLRIGGIPSARRAYGRWFIPAAEVQAWKQRREKREAEVGLKKF